MDTGISSSLIPHEAITMRTNHNQGGGLEDLMFFLAVILLVVSVGLAGASFFYKQITQTQIVSKQKSLENERQALDPSTIDHLVKVSERLQAADELLNAHTAPTALFTALSQATLQTVSFEGITYTVDPTDHKKINITMTGTAKSVNSVALQAEVFAKNPLIMNPIFTGVNRQQDGVRFSVTAQINPVAMSYSQLVGNTAQSQQQPAQQSKTPQGNPSPFGTPAPGTTQ